jgi:hypothetical protein
LGTRDQLEITPILGILVGIVTALFLVTVVILGALKVRAAHREGSRALRPGFLPVKEKVTLPLRSESEDLFEKDDKNPDVIPANKGKFIWRCRRFPQMAGPLLCFPIRSNDAVSPPMQIDRFSYIIYFHKNKETVILLCSRNHRARILTHNP